MNCLDHENHQKKKSYQKSTVLKERKVSSKTQTSDKARRAETGDRAARRAKQRDTWEQKENGQWTQANRSTHPCHQPQGPNLWVKCCVLCLILRDKYTCLTFLSSFCDFLTSGEPFWNEFSDYFVAIWLLYARHPVRKWGCKTRG